MIFLKKKLIWFKYCEHFVSLLLLIKIYTCEKFPISSMRHSFKKRLLFYRCNLRGERKAWLEHMIIVEKKKNDERKKYDVKAEGKIENGKLWSVLFPILTDADKKRKVFVLWLFLLRNDRFGTGCCNRLYSVTCNNQVILFRYVHAPYCPRERGDRWIKTLYFWSFVWY